MCFLPDIVNKAQQAHDASTFGALRIFSSLRTLSTFSIVVVGPHRWFSPYLANGVPCLLSRGTVEKSARSRMNICFRINGTDGAPSQELEDKFFAEGKKQGLVSVIRASLPSSDNGHSHGITSETALRFIRKFLHLYGPLMIMAILIRKFLPPLAHVTY